ncbi:hypothetical protein EV714DRAFT_288227 [Schizophyllum commune]
MSPSSKILVPKPVPRVALLGANLPLPQLRPSSPEVDATVPFVGVAGEGDPSVVHAGRAGSVESAQDVVRHARGEVAGLRAAVDRAHRTLGGVRATLSARDRQLRLVKEESAARLRRVQELEASITALEEQLAVSARQLDDLRVSLDFMDARRGTAARRFRFFKGRYDRAQYEKEGLCLELEGRAVEDARSAYQGLARLRLESSQSLRRLRARVQELTVALLARVPEGLYQRAMDRVSAYAAQFGPLPGVPADMDVGAADGGDEGVEMELETDGVDGEVDGGEMSGDADMADVDD